MIGRKGLLFNGQRAFSIHKGLSKISLGKGRQPSTKHCKSLNSKNLVAGKGKHSEDFDKTLSHTFETGQTPKMEKG